MGAHLLGADHAAYRWLFHRNLISNPSIALRRDALLAISGFDPSLPLEDIDCWLPQTPRQLITPTAKDAWRILSHLREIS